jgi:hypothetical protein
MAKRYFVYRKLDELRSDAEHQGMDLPLIEDREEI